MLLCSTRPARWPHVSGGVQMEEAKPLRCVCGAHARTRTQACLLASVLQSLASIEPLDIRGRCESVGVTPSLRHAVDDLFFNREGEGEWRRRQGR